jgi:acetyl-CoA carboxylase carboxyltransferase component
VKAAVVDVDTVPLERWPDMRDAEVAVVWDARVGGISTCVLGIESRPVPRRGPTPADGPDHWTAGTLFPMASKKIARAINAASGNRPVTVLANLSGFDGSPESLGRLQLEYGAEIGRAVTNFRGPIVFVVVSRYHGGAFVVFSAPLNGSMEIAAVEGSFASVIGGAPAAAVVFTRDVDGRTDADARVVRLRDELAAATGADKPVARAALDEVRSLVRTEKLGEVAAEFDGVHTIYRAQRMGSVHQIIPPERLRPYVIDALERGIARELDRWPPPPPP